MSSPISSNKSDGRSHSIELNLREVHQLFNSMDPSPFNERDLDDDAEEFIVSWAQEYPAEEPLTLRIHLGQWPSEDPSVTILEGIHNHFAARARLNRLEFKRLMKQGQFSLLIGLPFLVICLLITRTLLVREGGAWAGVIRESLTIAGWVAMWRPMQIYLYDWWPIRRRGSIYTKLSRIPIEVIPSSATQ